MGMLDPLLHWSALRRLHAPGHWPDSITNSVQCVYATGGAFRPSKKKWRLGALISCSSSTLLQDSVEVALLPSVEDNGRGWTAAIATVEGIIVNGWTRFNAQGTTPTTFWACLYTFIGSSAMKKLGSARRITSSAVSISRQTMRITQNPPDGYLFLCPTENFQSGPSSFQWPDGPAYWFLDSSGVERLSVQAASALGFSAIELTMDIWGHSWAARVYEAVRRFHQAKGFDPDTQDVARHLDYPPYELSSGQDIPFAHVEDEHGATHDEEIQKLAENGEDDRLGSDDDDSVLGLNTFTPGDENPETLTLIPATIDACEGHAHPFPNYVVVFLSLEPEIQHTPRFQESQRCLVRGLVSPQDHPRNADGPRREWERAGMRPVEKIESFGQGRRYLQEYRERVASLEEELNRMLQRTETSTKDELDLSKGRLLQVKSEKAALRQEVATLQDALKAKQEIPQIKQEAPHVVVYCTSPVAFKLEPDTTGDLSSPPEAPNTVLADVRRMLQEERLRNEALQAKCTSLEMKVKESAQLASTAFVERVEGERMLDKMRVGTAEIRREMEEMQKACDKLHAASTAEAAAIEAKDAAMADLRSQCESLKADKTTMLAVSAALEGEIASLKDRRSVIKAKYKTVKTEKEELQQTCRELVDLVEGLEEEVRATAVSAERCLSAEAHLAEARNQMPDTIERYRKYMRGLPLPETRQPAQLEPVCYRAANVHAYLAQDTNTKSFLNHVLYLPERTLDITDLHFVAFGPMHRYDRRSKKWIEGSDLASLQGGTRELFVNRKELVHYMGTYACHDLRTICSDGSDPPSQISASEIADAAFGLPRLSGSAQIIEQCYRDGKLKVVATGLQYIGFNHELYDSLRRRFADAREMEGKRKPEDEGDRENKGPKRRKG
ncbi:hypothetical protein DFH09DRAFT_1276372 [Mycena vulgaris]|nr:hypothetical protein DFH09DRAFT_1276372 [Mycena vulgaris]